MNELVIIDGNSLINRAFYALPLLANFEGEYSNAVFGFTNILVKVINEIQPEYICVAFDYARKTFRNEIYPDYKGTRGETPQELKPQFDILKQLLQSMNIKILERPGIEADDIIGSLANQLKTPTLIITGDKDAYQLINDYTKVIMTKKGISETIIYDKAKLFEDYKISPSQVIDLKALMGDASDNIPGVKGVGEKTAQQLLQEYKTLDNVYANIDNIKGRLKEKLLLDKDNAYLSKNLATIKVNEKFDISLQDLKYDYPFSSSVLEMFKKYQFNSLLKRPELFSEKYDVLDRQSIKKVKQVVLTDLEQIIDVINKIKESKNLYFNIDNDINLYVGDVEYTINFQTDLLTVGLDIEAVMKKFKPVFEDKTICKYVFDSKILRHKLNNYNIQLTSVEFDASIARYLINSNAKTNISLSDIIIEQGLNDKFVSYNIYQLYEIYTSKLSELELNSLYYDIELPLSKVLYDMEMAGFKIDISELAKLDEKYVQKIDVLTKKIYEVAGQEFNINSPKQMAELLFDKLKIVAYNNKKNSTNIDILNEIAHKHEIVPLLIEYRAVTKLYTTYIKAFGMLVNKETNKIHTIFNQTNTTTGRLSSNEPNLQNIPIRSDEGKLLRKIFISSFDDGYILSADYSQIELRLLANFSKDKKLIDAFNEGNDIHTATASEVFGVKLQNVTPAMRRDAKAINFGIIYGISDYGLSQNIGTTRAIAKDYIDKYFVKYPQVKQYLESSVAQCKNNGYVKTYFGRIRFLPEINSSNRNLQQFAERASMNMPLQGTASDIIKLAMVNVHKKLQRMQSKLILQVHDELIIDCPASELITVQKLLKQEMENVIKLDVELTVDVEYGRNWYEA